MQASPAAAADAKRYSRIVPAKQQAAEVRARVVDGWLSGGLLYVDGEHPAGRRPSPLAPPLPLLQRAHGAEQRRLQHELPASRGALWEAALFSRALSRTEPLPPRRRRPAAQERL